ncbi:hypothetical protein LC612_33075 [Nostoc sp. CHAB 5834]|nr:hypothetical protein [Nostoc sp. CHAB 5834]
MSAKLNIPGLPEFVGPEALPEQRMHWTLVGYDVIEKLLSSGVLRVQRNHARRVMSAHHVTKKTSPLHANFLAVRKPDGRMQLVDGYTRATAIEASMREKFKQVWLGVVDVNSDAEIDEVYLSIDSRKAVKTGRDAFEEGLRRAGLLPTLKSPLFLNGYVVSALKAASGKGNPHQSVPLFARAFEVLDPLYFEGGRNTLPAGALAASLLIAQFESDTQTVLQFVAALLRPRLLEESHKALVPGAVKFEKWLSERRQAGALSGKNVPAIMAYGLGCFAWQQAGKGGRVEPLSREDYLKSKSVTID